jgi:outer membrane protein assembly factor BamA
VQDHNIVVDSLRLFDLPLRLNARIGYLSSLSQNYCGVGGTVTCDTAVAAAQASANGLVDDKNDDDDAYDRFTRRYYQRRFMDPYGLVNLRYALVERSPNQPTRVELTGGYRAFAFIPGNIFADEDGDGQPDLTPYAGSLFAQDHPDGEGGLSSVVNLGIMIDSRDNEPAPTQGWWSEGSVRATTPGLSTWTFAGFNVTVRGYTTLPIALPNGGSLGKRLVLANRFTLDGLVGDVPIQEMARLGGSFDAYTFGGADVGRGVRVQRYLGKGRVINMTELRYRFAELAAFEQAFAFTAVGFVDAGIVADELVAPADVGVVASGGGALRMAWNENFIVRLDVGVSPAEAFAPQVYITVNQPF